MPSIEVRDVAERARLRAVAEDGHRLARERLADQRGHDAAVARAHPLAVGVEDPDDARVDAVGAVVGHRHRLGEALGLVVDAARADRVDVAPVGLGLRDGRAGRRRPRRSRRGGSAPSSPARGRARCACRASRPSASGSAAPGSRSGEAGEAKCSTASSGPSTKMNCVTSWRTKRNRFSSCEVRDVARVAGQQVVHRDDLVPLGEQPVAEVASRGSRRRP